MSGSHSTSNISTKKTPGLTQEAPTLVSPHFNQSWLGKEDAKLNEIQTWRNSGDQKAIDQILDIAATSPSKMLASSAFRALGELALVDNTNAQNAMRRIVMPDGTDADFKGRFWEIARDNLGSIQSCLKYLASSDYLPRVVSYNLELGELLLKGANSLNSESARFMVLGALVKAPVDNPKQFQIEALLRLGHINSDAAGALQLFEIATSRGVLQAHESLRNKAVQSLCSSPYRRGFDDLVSGGGIDYDLEIRKQFIDAMKSRHLVESLLKIALNKDLSLLMRHYAADAIFDSLSESSKRGVTRGSESSGGPIEVLTRLAAVNDLGDTSYRAAKALGESCLLIKDAFKAALGICRNRQGFGFSAYHGAVEAMGQMINLAKPFERQQIIKSLRELRSDPLEGKIVSKVLWSAGGFWEKMTAPIDFLKKWKKILAPRADKDGLQVEPS